MAGGEFYIGEFAIDGRPGVWVEDRDLLERRPVEHVVMHSPGGLAWGYDGSGPADTAMTILHDVTRDRVTAERLHQEFEREVVARLELNRPFTLPKATVVGWLSEHGVGVVDAPVLPVRTDMGADALELRVAALDARERAVAERERRLEQHERRLETRGAALELLSDAPPKWSVPAAPIATQIRALMDGTGEELAMVAKGMGIDFEWAEGVVSGRISQIDIPQVQTLCENLHCSPYDMWGTEVGQSIIHAYPPDLWPRFIEPLQPEGPDLEPPAFGPELGL